MNILKYYKFLFASSFIILAFGIVSLAVFGLKLGVDFTGGTVTEIAFSTQPDLSKIRQSLTDSGLTEFQLQTAGENSILIKTKPMDAEQHKKVTEELKKNIGQFEEKKFDSIGPTVGSELKSNAIWQLFLVSLFIILYIAYAFRRIQKPVTSWQFGVAAVIALIHDLVLVLGVFSLLGHYKGVEVDSLFITAMLTVLGFSVHDTIVVFDRIRENFKVYAGETMEFIVNHSISQTIVRSLNTSLTVLFVLLALLLFGGESIKYFVLALLIGIFTGTYSSIFIASPILVVWQNWKNNKKK